MVGDASLRRAHTIVKGVIDEARRRARRRRLAYASAAAALVVIAGVLALRAAAPPSSPPGGAAPERLVLAREPYLGVSCRTPNSIACDRIGLAVWLRRPAARLTATIEGRAVAVAIPCGSDRYHETCSSYCRLMAHDQPCGVYFEGFLRPAGLRDGALQMHPNRGGSHWSGADAPDGLVRVTAAYADGTRAVTRVRVPLRAGWG